jgi:hypothetical protein
MKKLLAVLGTVCLCSVFLFGTTGCPKKTEKEKTTVTKDKAGPDLIKDKGKDVDKGAKDVDKGAKDHDKGAKDVDKGAKDHDKGAKDKDGEKVKDKDGEKVKDKDGEKVKDKDGEKVKDKDGEKTKDKDGDKTKDKDGDKAKDKEKDKTKDKAFLSPEVLNFYAMLNEQFLAPVFTVQRLQIEAVDNRAFRNYISVTA